MDHTANRPTSSVGSSTGTGGVRLDTLLANLPGMAYRCQNQRDWCMVFVSEGCRELTGYAASELQGASSPTYADLVHPDDQARVWEQVQKGVAEGRSFEIEYRIRIRDGTEKWVWERGVLVDGDDNGGECLEGFIADISERKRLTDRLSTRGDRLEGELETRIDELRRMVNLMAGREIRMSELKQENARLRQQLRAAGLAPEDPPSPVGTLE